MKTAALLGLVLALGGCAGLGAPPSCPAGLAPAREARLYLGRNIAGQPGVSEEAFRAFLDAEVTPRFPDGLTVLDAEGRWRAETGRVEREASKVVVLVLPEPTIDVDARLAAVRAAYRRAFQQEAVLMTSQQVCAGISG